MAARKRREHETFKAYRLDLKRETETEKQRDKKYLIQHRIFNLPDANAFGRVITKVVGNTYRRPAFKP